MKKIYNYLMLIIFVMGLHSQVLAAPDTYIGDTAIYAALTAEATASNKPHVMFLIDTSQSTLKTASGSPYLGRDTDGKPINPEVANIPSDIPLYTGAKDPWTIYSADNQGVFSRVEVVNANSSLSGITCTTAGGLALKESLLKYGTYAGSGTVASPNLNGGACATGPSGVVYALGNYLNYLAAPPAVDLTRTVKNTYTCDIAVKSTGKTVTTTVVNGCVGTFFFTGTSDHTTTSSDEPMKGADWQNYWTQTSGGCLSTASTSCSTTSVPAALTVAASIPAWASGVAFTPSPTVVGGSQRKIIYDALTQVVAGVRNTVNVGAMTYNPANQGGKVIYDIGDLSSDAAFNAFKAALPGQNADGTLTGAGLISSVTNRPQAEALFDAGYYFGAKYPTSGTISSTALFPLNDSTFSRANVGTPMAGKYRADNRSLCQNNIIILITNGLSNGDNSPNLAPLADADGDGRSIESVYGNGSHYLDDVAAFLHKQDDKIKIYTVLAFQTADPLLERASRGVGGGEFFNVYDAATLAAALGEILKGQILETSTSFVAPVVPASSTNRTVSSNRVYLGLFKPQTNGPWLGNLKRYGVSSELTLLDRNGNEATDEFGAFYPALKSYWGDAGGVNSYIMSSRGLLEGAEGAVTGDGGDVLAGGVGGTLLLDLQAGLLASPAKQAWETRKIYTWTTGSLPQTLTNDDHRFKPGNTNITAATLGVANDTAKDLLINFVAGVDSYDVDEDTNTTEIRSWVLGDILHSKPLIFGYNKFTEAQENSCPPASDDGGIYNRSMIFVGSNDGMLHAFRDCDGKEAWAFIPDNVLTNLQYLPGNKHTYFNDGPPTSYVHDLNGDNIITASEGDKVILLFGQGRGGGRSTLAASGARGAYYALDVTNPLAPVLLWKVDSNTANFAELGETWSPPRLGKVKVGTAKKVVAFVGAGYDNNEDLRYGNNMLFPNGTTVTTDTTVATPDVGNYSSTGTSAPLNPRGRGVFAIEVATLTEGYGACSSTPATDFCPDLTAGGTHIWSFVKANDGGKGMDYSIPSDLTVLDLNGDGFQDRIYVGDTGGQLWSFNVSSTDTDAWTSSARMIFKSNKVGETNKGRKIFYKPTVATVLGIPTLYFGTGDRSHPLNSAVTDRIFAVRDRGQTTAKDIDSLVNLTDNTLQNATATTAEINAILNSLASAENYGWYIDLNQNAGEKVLSSALVFNKEAFYTTFAPKPVESMVLCEAGNLGTSRLYQLDYATAEATHNYYGANDASTTYANNIRAKGGDNIGLQRQDRVKTLGVGIPSGIVTLIDASGKISLMISSSDRVGSYEAPDAKMVSPLYWMKY